jgi:hypothetical protein
LTVLLQMFSTINNRYTWSLFLECLRNANLYTHSCPHSWNMYKTCITLLPTWTRVQLRLFFLIANLFPKIGDPKSEKWVNIDYDVSWYSCNKITTTWIQECRPIKFWQRPLKDDEVCIPSLSTILLVVWRITQISNFCWLFGHKI